MFGFRRIAYMLLSRHFYVGFALGWFCAGLLAFGIEAHASTYTVLNHSTSTSASDFTWANGESLVIPSSTLQYYEGLGQKIKFFILQSGNTANISKPASFLQNGVVLYSPPQVDYRNTIGDAVPRHPMAVPEYDTSYDLIIRNDSGSLTNGLKQYFNSSATLSMPEYTVRNYSGTVGNLVVGAYVWLEDIPTSTPTSGTVFYPLGLNAIIDDMNCTNSATGTDCTFEYAEPISNFTPENLFFLTVLFFCFVFSSYWIVKKLW